MSLASVRRRRGWSQRELAQRLGTTQATISRWESGAEPCSQPRLLELALEHLDCLGAADDTQRMAEAEWVDPDV